MSNLVYDGTGGLFTRLGALIHFMDQVRTHQNNLKTLLANVQAEYSSSDSYMIDALAGSIEARIAEAGGVLTDVVSAAEKTLAEMCYASATASGSTITMRSKSVHDALVWLIRAMDSETTPETVNGTTITKSSLAVGASNNGNGKFFYQFEAPNVLLGSTADWPNIRSELLEARCIMDSQNGTIAAGSEVFEIRGQPAYDRLDYRFPGGSGVVMQMTSGSASVDAGGRGSNILTNSDLEQFTSNVPDNFTVSAGTAGTDFQKTTTAANVYRGSAALEMAATGTAFKLRQRFGTATGTYGRLNPDRPYVIACSTRKAAGSTGTFRVSVQDASGNILDSGNFKIELTIGTAFNTTWSIQSSILRTPRILPTELYFVVETTTGVATAAAYVDEIILMEMLPIAPGGPALAIVAGSTNWNVDDFAQYTFTNNNEGAFVRAFDRLFNMYGRGLSLPQNYAGTETIADTLIA